VPFTSLKLVGLKTLAARLKMARQLLIGALIDCAKAKLEENRAINSIILNRVFSIGGIYALSCSKYAKLLGNF